MTEVSIAGLVAGAGNGDQQAWDELVARFTPLLVGIIRQYRLSGGELEDVAQTVWLHLVEHLHQLRDPRALPSWIITTSRRESIRHLNRQRRSTPFDPLDPDRDEPDPRGTEPEAEMIQSERHQALLAGLAELPTRQRQLLLMLIEDPTPSYAEISTRTGIPIGAIGPTRARALARLRRTAPVRQASDSRPSVDLRTPASRSGGDSRDA